MILSRTTAQVCSGCEQSLTINAKRTTIVGRFTIPQFDCESPLTINANDFSSSLLFRSSLLPRRKPHTAAPSTPRIGMAGVRRIKQHAPAILRGRKTQPVSQRTAQQSSGSAQRFGSVMNVLIIPGVRNRLVRGECREPGAAFGNQHRTIRVHALDYGDMAVRRIRIPTCHTLPASEYHHRSDMWRVVHQISQRTRSTRPVGTVAHIRTHRQAQLRTANIRPQGAVPRRISVAVADVACAMPVAE